MRLLSSTPLLVTVLAAAVLCSGTSAAVYVPLAEDIDFGCGLVERGFHGLGVELLEQSLHRVKSDAVKRRVYGALASGNRGLARRLRRHLSPAKATAQRELHQKAADKYRTLLRKMRGTIAGNRQDLMALAEQAKSLHRELRLTAGEPARQRLLKSMKEEFEAVIAGMKALQAKALEAVGKKEEEDDGSLSDKKLRELEAAITALREKDLFAGIDLNRVRYWYSKGLPASEGEKKRKLLNEAIEGLDDYVNSYSEWLYSIVGNEMLARARMDIGEFEESVRCCEAGMDLIRAYVRIAPASKGDMAPWRERLVATWVLGNGKLEKFNRAIAEARKYKAPLIQLAMAEVMLLKAKHYRSTDRRAEGVAVRQRAETLLKTLAEKGEPWRTLVPQLLDKYDPRGGGFLARLNVFRTHVRARNNPGVINAAAGLLALGSDLPADRRALILPRLAMAYRQEGMYYEAYTVYHHIATKTRDDEDAEAAARSAVDSLKRQYAATKSFADSQLLDAAKKWRRTNFKGPGIEYERASEHKKQREYKDAIERFTLVKKTSPYFESALEQIGECHILHAKRLEKTKPAEAQKHFETGKNVLIRFLDQIKKPAVLPRVVRRRRLFQAAAQYRLATVYMRKGKEDYKKCLAVTHDYIETFPDSPTFHPYAMLLRLRALVATKRLKQAEVDLAKLQQACAAMKDKTVAGTLGSHATDILSNARVRLASKLRKQAAAKNAETAKADAAGDAVKAAILRKEAAALDAKAAEHANKALTIIMSAIAANPNLPFEKYYYVIAELHFQKRFNELSRYLNLFIDRFDSMKGLTKKQIAEVDGAHVMLAEAYIQSGQFRQAYDVAIERLAALAKADAAGSPEHWLLQKYIAMSAHQLARAAEDGYKRNEYIAIAIEKYLELRSRLRKGSADWWEVTIGAVEMQNLAGRHADNLVVIKRTLALRPELGGSMFRQRYIRVLEEMHSKLEDKAKKARAFAMLMKILNADLEQLSKDNKCDEILDVVRFVGTVAPDYGGPENQAKLRAFVIFAMKNAKDEETRKSAADLFDELRK